MLITVVVTSATRPMNDCMSRPGTGEGSLNTNAVCGIVDSTSGTVTATAVTVMTPAQK